MVWLLVKLVSQHPFLCVCVCVVDLAVGAGVYVNANARCVFSVRVYL